MNNKTKIDRRNAIKAGMFASAGLSATTISKPGYSESGEQDNKQIQHKTDGKAFSAIEDSNPLNAKIITFTTVSKNVDKSISFYRDVIGMKLELDQPLKSNLTTTPGIGEPGRRHAILSMPDSLNSASVRILEAPDNAEEIRPRPNSGPNDPGLLVMEGGTRDPAMSYHKLASAKTPMISPPRYYFFRNTMWKRDVDVMSYAPFGPGGEQMFITANIRGDRPEPNYEGLHSGFANAAITSLDQRPVNEFFEKALGLKRTSQMECFQKNTNELIGAPDDSYFLWGNVGSGVSIEVWEVKASSGIIYPCSLDKTGLAMLTIKVNDIDKCESMCQKAGIKPVGIGALPNQKGNLKKGFTLRGAVGELFEIVES